MLSVETTDEYVRVAAVYGEFNGDNLPSFGEIAKQIPLVRSRLVIDVSHCTAIHTSGITLLVQLIQSSTGLCELRVPSAGVVRATLIACGFSDMFKAEDRSPNAADSGRQTRPHL